MRLLPENEDDAYDSASTLPAEAYKAGVKFALGTFGNQFVRNLPYEATAGLYGQVHEVKQLIVTAERESPYGRD